MSEEIMTKSGSLTQEQRKANKAAYNKGRYRAMARGEWAPKPRQVPPARLPVEPVPFNAAAVRRASQQHLSTIPWWAHETAEERRAALEAKMDREVAVAPPRLKNGTPLPLLPIAA